MGELWDAMEYEFGYSPQLKGEQSLWGKIVRDLGQLDATAQLVHAAALEYRRLYPGAAFTPTALLKHYQSLIAQAQKVHKPISTVDPNAHAKVKGVPLAAIEAAARGEWEEAKRLGSQ